MGYVDFEWSVQYLDIGPDHESLSLSEELKLWWQHQQQLRQQQQQHPQQQQQQQQQ